MNILENIFIKICETCASFAETVGLFAFLRKQNKQKTIILMYHGVTATHDPVANFDQKHIEFQRFEKQIQYLKKYYSIISLEDFMNSLEREKLLPDNSVIITFDDGYQNNYTQLFPILKKYNVPATIFLPTLNISQQGIGWFDTVAYCIAKTKKPFINVENKKYPLLTVQQKIGAIFDLKMLTRNIEKRNRLLKDIIFQTGVNVKKCNNEDFLFLSWNQCREMQKSGISFGSHSVTHKILTALKEKELQKEMENSKKIIQKELVSCLFFSYPFGDHNEDVRKMLQKTGYHAGLSTTYGKNTKNTDRAQLYRIPINNIYNLPIFALILHTNIIPIIHHKTRCMYNTLQRGLNNITAKN